MSRTETLKIQSNKTEVERTIKQLVNRVSDELKSYEWDWSTVAEKAGVSFSTVIRFRDRDYKDSPLLSTVVKIGKVVGLTVTMDARSGKAKIRRAG